MMMVKDNKRKSRGIVMEGELSARQKLKNFLIISISMPHSFQQKAVKAF
jgi:hypothetical protein